MRTISIFMAFVCFAFIAVGQTVAQDRAELMAQVSTMVELSTANAGAISKLDSRMDEVERLLFGYEEAYIETVPYTAYKEVTRKRKIPPAVIRSVATQIVQTEYPQVTNYTNKSVTRTRNVYGNTSVLSNNAIRTKSRSRTSTRGGPIRRLFSGGQPRAQALCPT